MPSLGSVVRASSATDCNKNKNLNFIGFSQEHLTNYARPFFLNLERGKRSMQQKVPASLVRRRVVWPQNKAEVSSVSTQYVSTLTKCKEIYNILAIG